MRYEVQVYQEHTMSWKPYGHTDDLLVAVDMQGDLVAKGKERTRVLDREAGSSKAVIVN